MSRGYKPVTGIKKSASPTARRVIAYIVLIFLSVLCLFWFYLLLIYSTRSHSAIQSGISFIPSNNFIKNFISVKNATQPVFKGLLNSFIIATLTALLSTYFSTMTAYAIHVYDFKLKGFIFTFILMIMMVPTQVTVLGFVQWLDVLHLRGNGNYVDYIGLIVPSIAAPVTFYYLKQYMESALPLALIEAARIDGSNEVRTFNTIALPLMSPAISVQAIFTFVGSWNNYFVPSQVLTQKESLKTVPILLAELRSADFMKFDMGQVYMTIFLSIFPVIIVYLILSRNIVSGLSMGSVKG